MNKLPTCCDFYGVDCAQSDFCPARNRPADAIATFYAETEGVMPLATGCSTKALPDPSKQPLPEIDRPSSSILPALKWFGVLFVFTALSALCVLHGTRFFN